MRRMGDPKSDAVDTEIDATAPLAATERLLPTSRKALLCLALLFALSCYLRLLYPNESDTNPPLRADAGT